MKKFLHSSISVLLCLSLFYGLFAAMPTKARAATKTISSSSDWASYPLDNGERLITLYSGDVLNIASTAGSPTTPTKIVLAPAADMTATINGPGADVELRNVRIIAGETGTTTQNSSVYLSALNLSSPLQKPAISFTYGNLKVYTTSTDATIYGNGSYGIFSMGYGNEYGTLSINNSRGLTINTSSDSFNSISVKGLMYKAYPGLLTLNKAFNCAGLNVDNGTLEASSTTKDTLSLYPNVGSSVDINVSGSGKLFLKATGASKRALSYDTSTSFPLRIANIGQIDLEGEYGLYVATKTGGLQYSGLNVMNVKSTKYAGISCEKITINSGWMDVEGGAGYNAINTFNASSIIMKGGKLMLKNNAASDEVHVFDKGETGGNPWVFEGDDLFYNSSITNTTNTVSLSPGASGSVSREPKTSPPAVKSRSPEYGSTNVPVTSKLILTFNEPIVAGIGNIELRQFDNNALVATIPITDYKISITGKTLIISTGISMQAGIKYYVYIPATAIKDQYGVSFPGMLTNNVWNFTASNALPDTTAPVVSSFTPPNGSKDVALDSKLVIEFNENVVANSGMIIIVNDTDRTIMPYSVTGRQISVSGNKVSIKPTNNLIPATDYTVEISSSAIKDYAGNNYAGISSGNAIWSFTTYGECEMAGTRYITLNNALLSITPSAAAAINMLRDATINQGYSFYDNNITLNTNGKNIDLAGSVSLSKSNMTSAGLGAFNLRSAESTTLLELRSSSTGVFSNLTNTTNNGTAALINDGSTLTVKGNVSSTGLFGTGIQIDSSGTAIVEGTITAQNYIKLDGVVKGINDYVYDAAKPGYRKYTNAGKTATVWVKDTPKEITGFSANGINAAIDGTNIVLNLPFGTDISTLRPTVTHSGASVSPGSGEAHNFSSAAVYTVTATDGSKKVYSVTVNILPYVPTPVPTQSSEPLPSQSAAPTPIPTVYTPYVNPINGNVISGGGAAPGGIVDVRLPDGTMASTRADVNGNWSLTISGASNAGSVTVIVYDPNGVPSGSPNTLVPKIAVTSVAMPQKTLYMVKGTKLQLKYVVYPTTASSKKLTWKSSKKTIASVTTKGLVKALKTGITDITAKTSNNKQFKLRVYVVGKKLALKSVTAYKPPKTIKRTSTAKLVVKLNPAKATGAFITFGSSNSKVLKVDAAGKLTPVKKGTAYITVKAAGKSSKIKIVVK